MVVVSWIWCGIAAGQLYPDNHFELPCLSVEIQPKILLRNWKSPSSEIWRHVALYKFTEVSEGYITSICTRDLRMTVFYPDDECNYIRLWISHRLHCQTTNHCLQTHSMYFKQAIIFLQPIPSSGSLLSCYYNAFKYSFITQRTIRNSYVNNYEDSLMMEGVVRRNILENW